MVVRDSHDYDQGEGRRRWRALDLGTIETFLEADSPRVSCAEHRVVTTRVPWARHGAGHTYAFHGTDAWLATHCSKSAVRDLMRIAWRTVGSIVTRVVADAEARPTGGWSKASRSRLASFVKFAKTIRKFRDGLLSGIRLKINNARAEGWNNHVRRITRRADGFHPPRPHSSNDRNLWMAPRPGDVKERTFPRMI